MLTENQANKTFWEKLKPILDRWVGYFKFAFNKKISTEILAKLNVWEVVSSEEVTIDELIRKIADRTMVAWDSFKKNPWIDLDYTDLKVYPSVNDLIDLWWEVQQQWNTNAYHDWIYDHQKDEFRENFLWYIMSDYWNYNFNKMIFEHFMEENKKKYKIQWSIEYTTEIHKFLFKVVNDDSITLSEAFHLIFSQVQNGIELKAFYILCYELKFYQSNSISEVINIALNIIKEISLLEHSWLTKFSDKRIKYLEHMRSILELIKLDWKEINTDNIIKYSTINTFHLFQTWNTSALYNAIYEKGESYEFNKVEFDSISTIKPHKKVLLDVINTSLKAYSICTEKIHDNHFAIIKSVNKSVRSILVTGKKIINKADKDENDDASDEKSADNVSDIEWNVVAQKLKDLWTNKKLIREWLIRQKDFINSLEIIIESFIQAEKDNILWKKSWFSARSFFAKFASKRWLDEILKLYTLASTQWKMIYAFFLRRSLMLFILPVIAKSLWFLLNRWPLKRVRLAHGILNSYRFDISSQLKYYLTSNINTLIQLSNLEAEKLRILTIMNHWTKKQLNERWEEFSERLDQIESIFKELDKEHIYSEIRNIIAYNIQFQNRSFKEEVEHRYWEDWEIHY